MSFRVAIGSTHCASFSINGVPYMWQSGDVTTISSNENKITASDGAASDEFGLNVAVGCGRIVVGAPSDDDDGSSSGSAYIFDLDGNQLTKITASDAAAGDIFGVRVAVGSGKIVIGASGRTNYTGLVYVYDLDGSNEVKITASDGNQSDSFSIGLAVGCGKIVVGSPNAGVDAGRAYIYNLDGSGEFILNNTNTPDFSILDYDFFGSSVAVGCGRIVVGAYGVELPGGGGSSSIRDGMAYIFDLNGHYIARIDAGSTINASDDPYFGLSVAVGCGRIVIGARDNDSTTSVSNSGAAYIYDLNGVLIKRIEQYDPSSNDRFGQRVAVGCGRIVVSTTADNSSRGAAYVFDLDGNFLEKLIASDVAAGDLFGSDVSIANGRIVIGAYGDDDNGSSSGSAYIYETPDVITAYDVADWNSY